jgi:hypothetical protein
MRRARPLPPHGPPSNPRAAVPSQCRCYSVAVPSRRRSAVAVPPSRWRCPLRAAACGPRQCSTFIVAGTAVAIPRCPRIHGAPPAIGRRPASGPAAAPGRAAVEKNLTPLDVRSCRGGGGEGGELGEEERRRGGEGKRRGGEEERRRGRSPSGGPLPLLPLSSMSPLRGY